MLYVGAGFLGLLIGVALGLSWKNHEIYAEIKLAHLGKVLAKARQGWRVGLTRFSTGTSR